MHIQQQFAALTTSHDDELIAVDEASVTYIVDVKISLLQFRQDMKQLVIHKKSCVDCCCIVGKQKTRNKARRASPKAVKLPCSCMNRVFTMCMSGAFHYALDASFNRVGV